jgi:hypothetical protein
LFSIDDAWKRFSGQWIVSSRLDDQAGLIGAALIAIDNAMDPANIDRMIVPD